MMYAKSLRFGFVFTGFFLLVMPAHSSGQTLGEMVAWEGIDFKITQQADLQKNLTSGDSLESNEARIVATYVDEGGYLSETLYVFRFDKSGRRWSAAELRPHCGGAITGIDYSKNFIYLKGHINPSACCTVVLTKDLKVHDEVHGWVVGLFGDENVAYYHNQIHFTPAHCVELSIYSPQTRTHRQIYPMKPYQEIRRQYLAKVRAVYEKCCVESPPSDCGRYFHNHPCEAERFNSHLGSPVGKLALKSCRFAKED
jgi:hypothetical protein